jgi:general secretion pathway protein H
MSCCHKPQRGFTILEMMLVVLLIGLAASFVVYQYRQDAGSAALDKQANRFEQVLYLAQQEALFSGNMVALVVKSRSYQVFTLPPTPLFEEKSDEDFDLSQNRNVEPMNWRSIEGRKEFALFEFPKALQLDVVIDNLYGASPASQQGAEDEGWGRFEAEQDQEKSLQERMEEDEEKIMPIVIYPSGEVAAFVVTMAWYSGKDVAAKLMLKSNALGHIKRLDEEEAEF